MISIDWILVLIVTAIDPIWLWSAGNVCYSQKWTRTAAITLDRLDRRLRLVAGSVGDVMTVTEGDVVVAAVGFCADWAMAGTTSWSCEPATNWLVSGSDRQSPSSLDTNMAGSSVSMCVRLFDRPCGSNSQNVILQVRFTIRQCQMHFSGYMPSFNDGHSNVHAQLLNATVNTLMAVKGATSIRPIKSA